MARAITTEFQKFEFDSQEELMAAQILPQSNHQFIQTQLAMAMEERAVLTYDQANINSSIQQEAGLMGQITAYRYLLTCHEAALEVRRALNQSQ